MDKSELKELYLELAYENCQALHRLLTIKEKPSTAEEDEVYLRAAIKMDSAHYAEAMNVKDKVNAALVIENLIYFAVGNGNDLAFLKRLLTEMGN